MAKKVEIEIDVEGNIVESVANLKKLKAALRDVPAGTAEWDKIKNQIRDVEDSLESAGKKSEDLKGLLEAAPGPLGSLGRGIKQIELATKSWGAALKATGIGLLVGTIGILVAAFAKTEGAMNALKPVIIQIERALGGLVKAFTPLLEMFANLVAKILPPLIKGLSVYYAALVSLFTLVKEAGVGVAKILAGIFTLDTKLATEGVNQLKGSFGEAVKTFGKFQSDFAAGQKELTATEKEELEKRQAAEKEALDKRRQQQEEYRKKVEQDTKTANDKLLQLQNDYETLSAKSEEDANKIKLRQDFDREVKEITALQLKNQKINGIIVTAEELRANLLLQAEKNYQLRLQKLRDDDLKKFQDQTNKTVDLNTQFINKLNEVVAKSISDDFEKRKAERTLQAIEEEQQFRKLEQELIDSYKEIIKQYPAAREDMEKAITIIQEKAAIARKIISETTVKDLAQIDRDAMKDSETKMMARIDSELRILELRNQILNQKTQEYFVNQRQILDKAYEKEKLLQKMAFDALLEQAKGNAEEEKKIEERKAEVLLGIEKKYQADKKNLKQQEIAAYGEVASATISSFAAITGALAAGYDEEAKTSKKAFEQRKKLQVATAVMSAASGIIQILTQPSTLPSPFDWIVKTANALALGITTGIQISTIKKTKFEGTDGSGGTGPSGNNMGRGYADGGIVRGPGTSKSDSIPARLSNGEAVMTSGAVTMFAPLLSMMNQMGGGTSFSSNLNTTLPDNPNRTNPSMEQQPLIMKTYVVENELTSSQQRQARLKDLSTL